MYSTGAIFDQNLGGIFEITIAVIIAMTSQTACFVRVCRSAVENTMRRPMSESTVTATIILKLVFFCILRKPCIIEKGANYSTNDWCCYTSAVPGIFHNQTYQDSWRVSRSITYE